MTTGPPGPPTACPPWAAVCGLTNHEVAAELSIMPTTVKTYLRNTMRRLGARNRVETVHLARSAGLLN